MRAPASAGTIRRVAVLPPACSGARRRVGSDHLPAFLEALLTHPPCLQREAVLHEVQAAAAWLGPRETVAFEITPGAPGCRGTLCLWVTQTDLDEFSVVWTTRLR